MRHRDRVSRPSTRAARRALSIALTTAQLVAMAGSALLGQGAVSAAEQPDDGETATGSATLTVTPTGTDAPKAVKLPPVWERLSKLRYQTGTVTVGSQIATVDLPPGYRYLQQDDARFVVEQLWHNPLSPAVLGMVVPADAEVFTDDSWAIIFEYSDDGHVKDDDAAKLDAQELLKQMQESTRAGAEERRKHGFHGAELVGWAEPPHYDSATHKLYYAEDLAFDGNAAHTLNYYVRVLGRDGHLEMNAIASTAQLAQVAAGSQQVLANTRFTAGKRYEDFKPGYDKVAAYGIGGLIAGGLLLKSGLFAGLIKLLLAFIKPLIVVVLLGAGAIAKLLRRKPKPQDGI